MVSTNHVSIINPPLARAPVDDAANFITCDEFWPGFLIDDFRNLHRVDATTTDLRIRKAFRSAMATALIDLADWANGQIALGYASLADVPASMIDGESILVERWSTAVTALAKAELAETHRDYDATGAGDRRSDGLDMTIRQLRRDATSAIRDIKGSNRLFVELV